MLNAAHIYERLPWRARRRTSLENVTDVLEVIVRDTFSQEDDERDARVFKVCRAVHDMMPTGYDPVAESHRVWAHFGAALK